MKEKHPHIRFRRERPIREKRPRKYYPPKPPEDPGSHGRALLGALNATLKNGGLTDVGGFDDRLLFRFDIEPGIAPDAISNIHPEMTFVAQEEDSVVLAFATEAALSEFEGRLASLARDEHVTYKAVIYALRGVSGWGPEDRTGWALRSFGLPAENLVVLDVELWPLEDDKRSQDQQRAAFESWLGSESITIADSVKQPGLCLYRVTCDQTSARLLLNHRDVRKVDLPPSIGMAREVLAVDLSALPSTVPPDQDAPGIGVLDSGIASGHPLLAPAVGDSQSFIPELDPQDQHGHGTRVAGIALHGSIEDLIQLQSPSAELRLYSGKVLDDENQYDTRFIENQVESAVKYFNSEYGCRVFNLSFADRNKPFLGGHVRGLAYTLDALARELDVLFVVATGNHLLCEESPQQLGWRDRYPAYLYEPAWRILEPAPALNALCVGSIARYDQTFSSQRFPNDPSELPIARVGQPSPFTRSGGSVSGALKPDLVAPGGNWALNSRANYALIEGPQGLGVPSTSRSFAKGSPLSLDCGTSYSAPMVANCAALVFKDYPQASPNLVRALLCASARMPDNAQTLLASDSRLRSTVGYGEVNRDLARYSFENAVSIVNEARIRDKTHHFYEVPIPEDFVSGQSRRSRELSIGLAYAPIVRSSRVQYRGTRIEFKAVISPSLSHVTRMFNKATDEKDYKNIPEFKPGAVGQKSRNRGTVQADTWTFKQFNSNAKLRKQKLYVVVTRNDYSWARDSTLEEESYALVVSLLDLDRDESRLYSQVQSQIRARTRIRS